MARALFLISLLTSNFCLSQNLNFESLLRIFKYGGSYSTIPNQLAVHYFDHDSTATDVGGNELSLFADKIVFQTNELVALAVYTDCGAGGICQFGTLHVFNLRGDKISATNFESAIGDCGSYDGRTCIYASDTLLIFNEEEIEQDCITEEITKYKSTLEFVRFKHSDFHYSKPIPIDVRRKYYLGSNSFLTQDQLRNYNLDELSTIRNEIFASHGYIFKSNKWRDYFKDKDWYNPRYQNVVDSLSFIEKVNVNNILEIENK